MNIKVNPFKNNIGASISCDLKSIEQKTINQIKPFIKKKVNPPTRIYLPHLLFDNKFLNLVII